MMRESEEIGQRIAGLPPEKLALLLARLGRAPAEAAPGPPAIRPLRHGCNTRPLSFAQDRLWFIDQWETGRSDYNVGGALRLRGRVAVHAFEQALCEILRRHDVLRASFHAVEGLPVQTVVDDLRWLPVRVDLRRLDPARYEAELGRLARGEGRRPFELSRVPLFRAYWLALADDDQVLVFTLHHIVCDGWSVEVLTGELVELYRAFAAGRPSPLPELEIQYADYAAWQREQLQGERLERLVGYWRRQLHGAPATIGWRGPLPSDSLDGGSRAVEEAFSLTRDSVAPLLAIGREEGATPFMVFTALFGVALHLASGQEDLSIGANAAHRGQLETEGLIGLFVNQIVLRLRAGRAVTFRELLRQVREVTEEAHAHQDLPFERLVETLCPDRRAGSNQQLFQVKVDFQEAREPLHLPGVRLEELDTGNSTLRCDLLLVGTRTADQIDCVVTYDASRLGAETVALLVERLRCAAGVVAGAPDLRLDDLAARLSREVEAQRAAERERLDRMDATRLKNVRRRGIRFDSRVEATAMEQSENQPGGLRQSLSGRRRRISLAGDGAVREGRLSPEQTLPLVLEPAREGIDLISWAASRREALAALLVENGGILFRGFLPGGVAEFDRFIRALSDELLEYVFRSTPRTEVSDRIYTSTEYPAEQSIPLHNEMSYTRSWPRKIWFFSLQVAASGGETPIADSRKVFQTISPAVREKFGEKGVMYVRNYGSGLDLAWQDVFQTRDRAEVEAFCRKSGIDFEWTGRDGLRTRQVCQAVARHPQTGEDLWFNQAHLFHASSIDPALREFLLAEIGEGELPRNAYYGDHSPLEEEHLAEIREAYARHQVIFPWQEGDILMLDNMMVAHGRQPYTGSRRVVVGMAEAWFKAV
jgi:alpha-ketoglutarate-dependent taurine dioxygenase